jgi:hypothetical protein
VSVGHVARAIESSGIPTVCVFVRSFLHVAEWMGVPRTVTVRHPMGRPMGAPGDRDRQSAVLQAALALLEAAARGGTIMECRDAFVPGEIDVPSDGEGPDGG